MVNRPACCVPTESQYSPKVAHIAQLPGLDQMPQRQRQSDQNAKPSRGNVRDSEEGVLAPDEGDRREDYRFRTVELGDGVVWRNIIG